MEHYYFFTFAVWICAVINKKAANVLLCAGFVFLIFYLPTIDAISFDYTVYESAYELSYFINEYPYVATGKVIDAEELYIVYGGLFYLYTGLSYSAFLSFNFLLCVGISALFLKAFNAEVKLMFWLMFVPVILPTLFYFLIRSSISMFLVVLAIFNLLRYNGSSIKPVLLSLLMIYIGINIHSQYIVIAFAVLILFFFLRFKGKNTFKYNFNVVVISSLGLIGILLIVKNLTNVFSEVLGFLPTSDLATSKINYLTADDTRGARITAVLSIMVYPFMMLSVLNKAYFTETPLLLNTKAKERKFLFLFMGIIFYGAAINIAFLDSAHVAGRLGKVSDYLGMAILIPLYFRVCIGYKLEYLVLFIFVLIAPLLYSSIYSGADFNIF